MFYSKKPVIQLQAFLEQIWYCNHAFPLPNKTVTLPYGRIELVINLQGDYTIQKEGSAFEGKDAWISGQQKGVTLSTISGQHECLGVVFTPLGWKRFSGMDAGDLKNRFIEVSLILKNFSGALEQIAGTTAPAQKIAVFEAYLQQQIKTLKNTNANVLRALDMIRQSEDQKLTVNDLSRHLKISRKSLNKLFQINIGISAADYLQQRFFSHLLQNLCSEPHKRLIEHTYEHHFFDQSHFIKQFQVYAGMTPGEYLHHLKEGRIDPLAPNFISLQGYNFTMPQENA